MGMSGSERMPQWNSIADLQVSVTTTAAALTTLDLKNGFAVLQADPTNTGNIVLGNATSQHWLLQAGESFPFMVPIDQLNRMWADASTGTQKLNVLAFR